MPLRSNRFSIATCLVVSLSAAGCQKSPYELAPVSGKVMINGRPLTRAKVMFAPLEVGSSVNPGKPAFGMLQSDGSFVLSTYGTEDGAVLGEHWVTVVNLAGKSANDSAGPSIDSFSRLTLPKRVTVQADVVNEFEFNITADEIKQFGVQTRD